MACPGCGQETVEGAAFCHRCGAAVGGGTGPHTDGPHAGGPAQLQGGVRCPRCRAPNEASSRYCYQCGLPMEGRRGPGEATRPAPGSSLGVPAGFWARLAGYLIDSLLVGVVNLVLVNVVLLTVAVGPQALEGTGLGATNLLAYMVEAAYYTVAISAWSTTIGKRLLGLYVVRSDGSRLTAARALARFVCYLLSAIPLFAGFIMIGLRQDRRALHDIVCDTRVVRR